MTSDEEITSSPYQRLADRIRLVLALASLAGTVALAGMYALRPVRANAITIWPLLFTLPPVMLLGLASFSRRAPGRNWLLAVAWLAVLVGLTEEPGSLARSLWGESGREQVWMQARARGRALRVVSLNCYGGILAAAEEAFEQQPDVILLQEDPGTADLRTVCHRRGGWQVTATADCAILVRGRLQALPLARRDTTNICLARVWPEALRPGRAVTVVNVHLPLPALQAELWRRAAWRLSREAWEDRSEEMRHVAGYVAREAAAGPLVLGGDFNAPGRDPLFRLLPPVVRDAFPRAGVGWPNTWSTGEPLARIDQIWLSPEWQPQALRVLPTKNSDHRMVVCDVVLR